MACARRRAYQRPMNKGCSTMIAIKIQKRDEKSNDMARVPWRSSLRRESCKSLTCRGLRKDKKEMEDRSARLYTPPQMLLGPRLHRLGVRRCAHCRWGKKAAPRRERPELSCSPVHTTTNVSRRKRCAVGTPLRQRSWAAWEA